MRIWSLHPRYLDRPGLTACWRETLLAQAVLSGRTRGYAAHPQLERFRYAPDPLGSIAWYLHGVADEADDRGYHFNRGRIDRAAAAVPPIEVTDGQLDYEWAWLRQKLELRSPAWLEQWRTVGRPETHRSFAVVAGPVADWERVKT